jgi:lipopolysaccharide export system protein LptA
MNKKTLAQVFIMFLIILISILFYMKYFNESSEILEENLITEKADINQNDTSTYIDNIDYTSSDAQLNRYQVTAKLAEIKMEKPDLMFLTNVSAYIFIKNSETIKITSDFGKYNSINYDTIFSKNVIIDYPGHKITGESLDLSFLNNLGVISTNVIYTGDKTNLFADKVEINIITKDTKIFMNNRTEKVIVKGVK